jgi:hypothetical protein
MGGIPGPDSRKIEMDRAILNPDALDALHVPPYVLRFEPTKGPDHAAA